MEEHENIADLFDAIRDGRHKYASKLYCCQLKKTYIELKSININIHSCDFESGDLKIHTRQHDHK